MGNSICRTGLNVELGTYTENWASRRAPLIPATRQTEAGLDPEVQGQPR